MKKIVILVIFLVAIAAYQAAAQEIGSGPLDKPFGTPGQNYVSYVLNGSVWEQTGVRGTGHSFEDGHLFLNNEHVQRELKKVWLHFVTANNSTWNPGTDPWPVLSAPGYAVTSDARSVDVSIAGTRHMYQIWTIRPNPDSEIIDLFPVLQKQGNALLWFEAETWCVPEPSGILTLLAGVGGIGCAWLRRRR